MLRDPLLDLDDEDMVVKLRRKRPEENAELKQHVWVSGNPLPVLPLAKHTNASAD